MILAEIFYLYGCINKWHDVGEFLKRNGVDKVKYNNAQIPYVRERIYEIVKEQGGGVIGFPIILIEDNVVIGFKSRELMEIIKKIKEKKNG